MRISEVMSNNVECIPPTATVLDAARRMKALDVGSMPVCGEQDRLVGMLTDRDIVVRCAAEGKDPSTTTVEAVMTPDIVYCREDQDIADAVQIMEDRQIRRLIVIDEEKRLVGIVSLGDLAVKTGEEALCGEALEAVCSPAPGSP